MHIAGKTALVSGIGRATVLALTAGGANVVIADIDEPGGREAIEFAAGHSGAAVFARCDVTKTADLEAAVALAIDRFGSLDIAFNNAGIGDEDLVVGDGGNWERVIAIHLAAVINATRIEVRQMRAAGRGGVIVNTASLIGLEPMSIAPVYGAAKAGVVNFSQSLGNLSEESNIRVNGICPEIVATPMTLGAPQVQEMARAGKIIMPEEIAAAVVELIEDDSRAGAVLKVTVEGGRGYWPT